MATPGGASFASVLANVDYIGFSFAAPANPEAWESYGIDNWDYSTPEPGTFASMSMLLLLGGSAMRRKLSSLVRRQEG